MAKKKRLMRPIGEELLQMEEKEIPSIGDFSNPSLPQFEGLRAMPSTEEFNRKVGQTIGGVTQGVKSYYSYPVDVGAQLLQLGGESVLGSPTGVKRNLESWPVVGDFAYGVTEGWDALRQGRMPRPISGREALITPSESLPNFEMPEAESPFEAYWRAVLPSATTVGMLGKSLKKSGKAPLSVASRVRALRRAQGLK